MQNFQNIIEICKQLFISAFSICMIVPLNNALVTIFSVINFSQYFVLLDKLWISGKATTAHSAGSLTVF